jgi:large subunit ribosomal protein L35Ae
LSQKIVTGRITNYRIGIKAQQPKECLIEFNMNIATAGQLVGKKVVWSNDTKKIAGKIVGLHGRNGIVKARFSRGLPGQAIGTEIQLIE